MLARGRTMDSLDLAPLRVFRSALHSGVGRRADALFEATDALLASAPVASLPPLSLAPCHRRGWGSVDAALAAGRIAAGALRAAVASPERGYSYHPSRDSAGRPIVAGCAHEWLAQLGFDRDSGTAPLDVRRVRPAAFGVRRARRRSTPGSPATKSRTRSSPSCVSKLRILGLVDGVGHEIDADDREEQGQPREDRHPPRELDSPGRTRGSGQRAPHAPRASSRLTRA